MTAKQYRGTDLPAGLATISCRSRGDHAFSSHVLPLREYDNDDQADMRDSLRMSSLLRNIAEQSVHNCYRMWPA